MKRDQGGFSLLEVMVGMGVATALSLGVAGVISSTAKQTKIVDNRSRAALASNSIQQMLGNASVCAHAFRRVDHASSEPARVNLTDQPLPYTESAEGAHAKVEGAVGVPQGNLAFQAIYLGPSRVASFGALLPDTSTLKVEELQFVRLDSPSPTPGGGAFITPFELRLTVSSPSPQGATKYKYFLNVETLRADGLEPIRGCSIQNGIAGSGSGTPGRLAKWANATTLTDSVVHERNGNIGIGTTNPDTALTIGSYRSTDRLRVNTSDLGLLVEVKNPSSPTEADVAQLFAGILEKNTLVTGDRAQLRLGFKANNDGTPGDLRTFAAVEGVAENAQGATRRTGLRLLTSDTGHSQAQERLRISGAGKVGIGTAAPQEALQIGPEWTFRDGYGAGKWIVFNGFWEGSKWQYLTTNPMSFLHFGYDGKISFGANPTAPAGSQTTTPPKHLTIANDGNIGIGTDNPADRLVVRGPAPSLRVIDSGAAADYAQVGAISGAVSVLYGANAAASGGYGYVGTQTNHPLRFYTNAGAAGAPALTITNNGLIGVGSSTPTEKLEILAGDLAMSNNTSIRMRDNTGTKRAALSYTYANNLQLFNRAATGDVQIGNTNNPSGEVHFYTASTNGSGIEVRRATIGAQGLTLVNNGKIYVDNIQICSIAGCTSSSDRRLKENITSLDADESLAKILGLQGVTYDWKDRARFGASRQIGLIAQEVERIYPEAVVTNEKTGLKSIAYDHLVAPLIEAVKALYEKLGGRLEKLERENAELKARLARVEAALAKR
ncbi:MAG: tail fiber domain-containing protein [Bacteriovoracia bacterium]